MMAKNDLHSRATNKRKRAEMTLCNEIDRFSSCKFIDNYLTITEKKKIFSCNCKSGYPKKRIEVVCDQQLRNLRTLEGTKEDGSYLYCIDCKKKFTATEVGLEFLRNVIGLASLEDFPDQRVKRLKVASMIQIQKEKRNDRRSNALFEGSYNHHAHAKTACFKYKCSQCKKTVIRKEKSKIIICMDCRYMLPKPPGNETRILQTGVKIKWYKPDGSYSVQEVKETAPKRSKYDLFQNQSVPCVGRSRLIHGNTNVSLLQDGPSCIYVTKYNTKGTQDDDNAEFDRIGKIALRASQRMNNNDNMNEELTEHERNTRNRQEALKRVLAVAFVLHSSSVIGAPLAAYLVRNKSRFILSHQTRWCPLLDIEKIIMNKPFVRYLIKTRAGTYMTNDAMDYLCRPNTIVYESMSAFEFYQSVEVLRSKPNKDAGKQPFINTSGFMHPSYDEQKNIFCACVRIIKEENKRKLCQILIENNE